MPILIYGAGQTGQQLATALATDDAVEPLGFIDDDRRLQGLLVAGLKVLPPSEMEKLIKRKNVKRVVLAMRYLHGWGYGAIASALSVSEGAARVRAQAHPRPHTRTSPRPRPRLRPCPRWW